MINLLNMVRLPLLLLLSSLAATFPTPATHATELLGATQPYSLDSKLFLNENLQAEKITANIDIDDVNNREYGAVALSTTEQPFLVEHGKTLSIRPINQTHMEIQLGGNGTLMLPNSTETIETMDTGNGIIKLTPTGNIAQGHIVIQTEDGSENATAFFTEIGQNQRGIGIAYFATNSTGKLAFLNNLVSVLESESQPNGNTVITAWAWNGQ
jgi:hypothetical protein